MGFFEKSLGEGIVGLRQAGFEVPQSFQIPGFLAAVYANVVRVILPTCSLTIFPLRCNMNMS